MIVPEPVSPQNTKGIMKIYGKTLWLWRTAEEYPTDRRNLTKKRVKKKFATKERRQNTIRQS